MAAVTLLRGGERASYSRLRNLFAAFDAKLAQMLSGKSFLVGQFGRGDADLGAMPAKLMGRCFFFTSGATRYCDNAPGFIADGFGGARPYDHTQFELALAAATVASWDETNKVANIDRVDTAWYAGLPQEEAVGFFEHSLAVHSIPHTGAGDSGDVPYYVREAAIGYLHPPPEKRLRYGLAEILLEGVTTLVLPGTSKYDCYRLHNLNFTEATVELAGETENLTVTLAAFDCRTVRRQRDGNFELTGWHYFFPPRGAETFPRGDPRLPWFLPTKTIDAANDINDTYVSAEQGRAANSMAANNLTNPSIICDWVNHFDPENRKADYAPCLHRDRDATGAEEDISDKYLELFGDPGDPATLLGDLLHHKGRIVIIRKSLTETDPLTSQPVITRDEVTFNGYATIVADFAEKLLSVTEDVDGNLVIDNDDPDNDVDLLPIGTNLFKTGESSPTIVTLPHTIEAAVFETTEAGGLGGYTLSATADNVVQQRSVAETTDVKHEYIMEADGDIVAHDYTATDTEKVMSGALTRSAARVMAGIHAVTVADLLDLSWWGDDALPDQSNDWVTFSNVRLLLTWEGLVLRFTESIAGYPNLEADYLSGRRFGGAKERRIWFRSHGWPYHSPTLGGWTTGWLSPRKGRFTTSVDYDAEEVGLSGADFAVSRLRVTEQDITVLRRIRNASTLASQGDTWLATPNARFWHARFMDNFLLWLEEGQSDAGYWNIRSYLLAPQDFTDDPAASSDLFVCMALLPEHYNALATTVNSLTSALPLNAFSLRWVIGGDVCWLPEMGRYSNVGNSNPVPITEWTEVPASSDSNFDILLAEFGVTIRDKTDLPSCPDTLTVKYNINEAISITADNFSGPDGGGYMTGDLHLSLSVEDNTEWYYSTSNPLYPTEADLDPFRYIPVGGPNMQTGYDDYNWVTIEDIKTTFGQWGIPVLGVQVCKPLNLVEFSRADATFNWSSLLADDSFSIIADVIPDPLPSLVEGNDNYIPLSPPENYKSGLMFAPAIIRGDDSALWKTLGGVAPGNQVKTNIDSVGDTQLLIEPGLSAAHPIVGYTGGYNLGLEALWEVNPPSRDPDDWPANYAWWFLQLPYDEYYNTLKNTVTWGIISENCRLTVTLVKRNYWERPVSWVDAPSFVAAVYADDIPWSFTAASGLLERITSQPGVWTDVKPTASQPFFGDGLYDLTDVFITLT